MMGRSQIHEKVIVCQVKGKCVVKEKGVLEAKKTRVKWIKEKGIVILNFFIGWPMVGIIGSLSGP